MLSGLRYFEHALKDNGRGKPKPSFSWGAVDMGSVARCFQQLCVKAVDVFQSEPRLLEVSSPTYVLGELVALVYHNWSDWFSNLIQFSQFTVNHVVKYFLYIMASTKSTHKNYAHN